MGVFFYVGVPFLSHQMYIYSYLAILASSFLFRFLPLRIRVKSKSVTKEKQDLFSRLLQTLIKQKQILFPFIAPRALQKSQVCSSFFLFYLRNSVEIFLSVILFSCFLFKIPWQIDSTVTKLPLVPSFRHSVKKQLLIKF